MDQRRYEKPEDFYATYEAHREYVNPELRPKHIRQFDRHVWGPGEFTPGMSVLEVGCGTGLFLAYLRHKGVENATGIDLDPLIKRLMPEETAARVVTGDVWAFLGEAKEGAYDRVVLLDVLEHFSVYEGVDLLRLINRALGRNGKVIVRVPNMSSPFGGIYQYHDLTHKASYSPGALGQVALASGFADTRCLAHRRGSGFRKAVEGLSVKLLGRMFTETPEIWSANMMGVLSKD